MKSINSFRGKYSFLSNFYESPIIYNGILYRSVEYAYQCAKVISKEDHELIRLEFTPGRAKRLANMLTKRNDWEDIKLNVMKDLLRLKFTSDENLKQKLIETREFLLIEENQWKDTFWGIYKGEGNNHLGILLMDLREELSN